MIKFNFQLFADTLDIPGIDEDILKELAAEEPTEETTEVVEPAEEPKEEPSAEADSVNKQVEVADEFEDVKEGQTIPYDRFKSVNDRRKNAESRIKELEEQLKAAKSGSHESNAQLVSITKNQNESEMINSPQTEDFTDEQEKRIYEIAAQRVKEKKNYSDEDIEALEYSDDPTAKMRYQKALNNEVNNVVSELRQYAAEQKRYDSMTNECSKEFEKYSQKFSSYADAQDRWKYISQERFLQLSQRRQNAINDAFNRLQAKKGTYTDLEIVSDYFDAVNEEWEQAHTPGATLKPKSNKLYEAQKLPKAPGITGGSGSDVTLTNERIAEILNTPGAWESLSAKEQEAILSGRI